MPMKKPSTPTLPAMTTTNTIAREVPEQDSSKGPRKSTLALLRQFARCYHFENGLTCGAGSMVLN